MTMHSESSVALAASNHHADANETAFWSNHMANLTEPFKFSPRATGFLSFQTHSSIHFGPSSVEREVDICLAKSFSACRISNVCAICLRDGEEQKIVVPKLRIKRFLSFLCGRDGYQNWKGPESSVKKTRIWRKQKTSELQSSGYCE